jgi:hypothetical protein
MKRSTKALLLISLTGFVLGSTTNILWGIGLPIGAVFFGLFLISKLLEKEVTMFDEEKHLRLNLAMQLPPQVSVANSTERVPALRVTSSAHA